MSASFYDNPENLKAVLKHYLSIFSQGHEPFVTLFFKERGAIDVERTLAHGDYLHFPESERQIWLEHAEARGKGVCLAASAKEMLEQLIETTKSEGRQARIWYAAVYRNEMTGEEFIHPHFMDTDARLLRRRTISAPMGFTLARRTKVAVIEMSAEKEAEE